jgi:hypothetical protein
MVSIGLTRKEKEKLVIDLYKEGMTYAQIAKEAHVSLRDIGPILNRAGEHQSLSYSSQAYKMFSEGSTPIDVAIALNLREKDVSDYYKEYWSLNGMYQLNQIYTELEDGEIWSVIELHRRIQTEGLSPQQAIRILKMTMTLEHNNRDLEGENARLEVSNQQAAKDFQKLTDLIQKDHKTLEENYSVICQQKREIENLNIERTRLQNTINSIRLHNETFIKIKQIAKQEIESALSNPRKLLRLALASLFESERKNPGKLRALYYNSFPTSSVEQFFLQSSNTNPSVYNEDSLEKIILDEAEQFYNKYVEVFTGRCIYEILNETGSGSKILEVPYIELETSGDRGYSNLEEFLQQLQENYADNNIEGKQEEVISSG